MVAEGPSSNAACRVLNRNSCGSGSKLAQWNGGSLIMTNAHVAGDQIGREVRVEFLIDGQKLARPAKIIEAMYSNQVTADWALLFCEDPLTEVPGVKMTKKMVRSGQDLYTRGCPRCVWPPRDSDADIIGVRNDNGVAWWTPDSVGGQSGSAVWDDQTNLMCILLTWSWHYRGRMRGAGQPTGYIYQQQQTVKQTGQIIGHKRPEGLITPPLPEDFVIDWDQSGLTDPELSDVFYVKQAGLRDYPIWAEDSPTPPADPEDPVDPAPPSDSALVSNLIEWHRDQSEAHSAAVLKLQGLPTIIGEEPNKDDGITFDL